MIGRLSSKSDFERVLATPACSRSAHFAVHHVQACPSDANIPVIEARTQKLCTGGAPTMEGSVDNSSSRRWLGQVLPKRHAPRSVTRNLLRRLVRAAVQRHETRLGPGMWLVRLRQPFATATYRSADSAALRLCAADELDRLLSRAAQWGR
jgi:ribonuclease P protein component